MASSLVSLYPDEGVTPPYETVDSNIDGDIPSVIATGGVISNFQDCIIDNTILDVETCQAKTFPLNVPLPIPRIGGVTSLPLYLPVDNLINPSSLNVTVVFSICKRDEAGKSIPIVKEDGIVCNAGYYPWSNCSISFDNSDISLPDMANLDLTVVRNLRMMEMVKNSSYEDLKRIHQAYSGWHLNFQSFADSKIGNWGSYTHTDVTHVITEITADKTGDSLEDILFNFHQDNIRDMLSGELISTVEFDQSFLNNTRIMPFLVKDCTIELKWCNIGDILSQEQPVPATKDGVYDKLHFVVKNVYYSYQNVLASPELINSFSSLAKTHKHKDVINDVPIAFPSWIVRNIHKYDVLSVPTGQSSILINLKGRLIPEQLIIIMRRKAMLNSKIGNNRYFDFPGVKTIRFSSPTYSHLKYLEEKREGLSMFHKSLDDIFCLADYKGKTRKNKNRILKQLEYLTLYSSRATRNISLEGTADLITTPEIFLNGGSYFSKSYRKTVMSGPGVKSKPILADIKVEIVLGKALSEEYQIEIFGVSDGILSVQADRSFRLSLEESGTSVKQSIAVHETMSRMQEDMNTKMSNI